MSEHDQVVDLPRWWHSEDPAPQLTASSLGLFFHETLSAGGRIGMIWPFNYRFKRSMVTVSVFMTETMKNRIETNTKFRFRKPPRISLIQYDDTRADRYEDWKVSEDVWLKKKGARWFHTDDHQSPSLSKSALGSFFNVTLSVGAQIGSVHLMKPDAAAKGIVYITVLMTEEMKAEIERNTRVRFRDPPGAAFDD